jgi:hypothetical protein
MDKLESSLSLCAWTDATVRVRAKRTARSSSDGTGKIITAVGAFATGWL